MVQTVSLGLGLTALLLLSVARGGLALGMGLGYALDVKNLSAVNVEFYTGVDERLPLPVLLTRPAGGVMPCEPGPGPGLVSRWCAGVSSRPAPKGGDTRACASS